MRLETWMISLQAFSTNRSEIDESKLRKMFGWLRRSCYQNLVAGGGGCRCVNSDAVREQ
ncbi:hypothetical protein RchiOBHm_Chr0c44g0503611 [Rosa chinensis]|uniref:Uncharacterized protein n=1 Tax=Rosa chinensis TaxID=74649 RepID=A0A2P6SQ12_ROSCH|nr:hypothetical protein RchiOBHm_Chr0c44g0503611 [Rosa chinensis]